MSDNDEEVAEYPSSEDERDKIDSFMSNQRRSRQLEEFNVEHQHDSKEDVHSEHQTTESLEREVKDQNEQQRPKHQNFHKNQTRHEYGQASHDVEPKQVELSTIQNSVDSHQIQLLHEVGNQHSEEPIVLTQSHFDHPHQQHDNNEQENVKDSLQQKQFLQQNNEQETADNQRPEPVQQPIEVIQHQNHEEQVEQTKPIHEELVSIPQEAHHDQIEQNKIEREGIVQVEQTQVIERRQESIEPYIEAVNHYQEEELKGQHLVVDNNKSVHSQHQVIPNQSSQSKNEVAQQHNNGQIKQHQSHEVNHNQINENQQINEQKIQDQVQGDHPVLIVSNAKTNQPQQVQVQTEKNNLNAIQDKVKQHDRVIQVEEIRQHQHDNQNQRIIQEPTASLPVEESTKVLQEKIERQQQPLVQQKPQEETKLIQKERKKEVLAYQQEEEIKSIKKQVKYQSIPQKQQENGQKVERQPLMPQKSNTIQAVNPQKKGQFEELLKEKPKTPARGNIVEKGTGKEGKNCECEIM